MQFAKPVIAQVMARTDPRRYNGALFVGLNGVVVKSHGGTDPVGFANAIGVGVDMVSRDLNRRIADELARMAPKSAAGADEITVQARAASE
jgi:glycerol-3-phosphate acyltransferase PlsX